MLIFVLPIFILCAVSVGIISCASCVCVCVLERDWLGKVFLPVFQAIRIFCLWWKHKSYFVVIRDWELLVQTMLSRESVLYGGNEISSPFKASGGGEGREARIKDTTPPCPPNNNSNPDSNQTRHCVSSVQFPCYFFPFFLPPASRASCEGTKLGAAQELPGLNPPWYPQFSPIPRFPSATWGDSKPLFPVLLAAPHDASGGIGPRGGQGVGSPCSKEEAVTRVAVNGRGSSGGREGRGLNSQFSCLFCRPGFIYLYFCCYCFFKKIKVAVIINKWKGTEQQHRCGGDGFHFIWVLTTESQGSVLPPLPRQKINKKEMKWKIILIL